MNTEERPIAIRHAIATIHYLADAGPIDRRPFVYVTACGHDYRWERELPKPNGTPEVLTCRYCAQNTPEGTILTVVGHTVAEAQDLPTIPTR